MSDSDEFPGFSRRWDVDAEDVDEVLSGRRKRPRAGDAPGIITIESDDNDDEEDDDDLCVLAKPPSSRKSVTQPSVARDDESEDTTREGRDSARSSAVAREHDGSTGAFVAPGDKCPICLSEFDVIAFLDRCFHAFCFQCVLMWAATSRECPLCKTPFGSLIYDVESPRVFKTYAVDFARLRGGAMVVARTVERFSTVGRKARQLVYERGWRPSKCAVGVASRAAARTVPRSEDVLEVSLERLRPFVQRDLEVLLDDAARKDDMVLEFVIGAIRRVWPDTRELARAVTPFLGDAVSDVFVRELELFLQLGYDIVRFDAAVTYEPPPPS